MFQCFRMMKQLFNLHMQVCQIPHVASLFFIMPKLVHVPEKRVFAGQFGLLPLTPKVVALSAHQS